MHGGGQEKGLRSGTENMPGIVGLGKAAELARENLETRMQHNKEIRDALIEKVTSQIKDAYVNGSLEKDYQTMYTLDSQELKENP